MNSELMIDVWGFVEFQVERGIDPGKIVKVFKWYVDNETVLIKYFEFQKGEILGEKLIDALIDNSKKRINI
jgi:hypothetical protein